MDLKSSKRKQYQHRSRPGTVGEEWRCKEYRTMHHCPAACKTENDAVIKHWGEHNHPAPTEAAIALKSSMQSMIHQKIFNNYVNKRVKQ